MKQPLAIELNIAELLEDDIHSVYVGEALHGDQPALLAGFIAMDPNDLAVA